MKKAKKELRKIRKELQTIRIYMECLEFIQKGRAARVKDSFLGDPEDRDYYD